MTAPGEPMLPRFATVAEIRRECPGVVTLVVDADGPEVRPGQTSMLYAFGIGEVPISVSGIDEGGRLEHTVRTVGAVTEALAALRPGSRVGLRGPYGRGWPLEGAHGGDLLIVAGGLGLAPLRPAIRYALAHRSDYGEVALLYGARSPDALLFAHERAAWADEPSLQFAVTVDRAPPDWSGHVGVVTELLGGLRFDPARVQALICGPEVMMRHTARALADLGVGAERIWLSLERNMKCAVAHCGRCQMGPHLVCRDGPVLRYDRIAGALSIREL